MGITRRTLIGAAAPMLLLPGRLLAAIGDTIAETEAGKVRGSVVGGVHIYRGIPYAGSVSGANRFKPAKRVKPWAGVRNAMLPGTPSIQPPGGMFGIAEPAPAEDCLNLTVWTPANDGKKRPVMFYSHGGGFSSGSNAAVLQDGANLARLYDVVVVSTNHRLGLLGYLYLDHLAGPEYAGSGNCGMLDIIAGLGWVSRNIERFGGDPDNVMIFGESGGGAKTSCLYAMPGAEPYFNKASIESGPGIRMTQADQAARLTESVLSELGIGVRDWRRLLNVPAAKLLEIQLKLSGTPNDAALRGDKPGGGLPAMKFSPVIDGKALPAHPFDPAAPAISRNKSLIVGYNRDEAAFFAYISGDVGMFNVDEAGLRERLKPIYADYERPIGTVAPQHHPQIS
jgi:para-nitrobenzyl esterase